MTDHSLLQDFVTETTEHLEEMERCLLALDSGEADPETLNGIFRSVHTIKGSAEYIGLAKTAQLSHKLENLLDLLRRQEMSVSQEIVDLLMAAHDRIGSLLQELDGEDGGESGQVDDLLGQIDAASARTDSPTEAGPAALAGAGGGTGPSAVEKIDLPAGDASDVPECLQPEGDPYQEPYDRELFDIFLGQLRKGLKEVRAQAARLASAASPAEILDRCIQKVESLRASANYMGYDRALAVYEGWKAALDQARRKCTEGAQIDWDRFAANGIEGPAKILEKLFSLSGAGQGPDAEANVCRQMEVEEIESLMDDILSEETPAASPGPGEGGGFPDEGPGDGETPSEETVVSGGPDLSLIDDFISETHEQLQELEQHLVGMAAAGDDPELLNAVFRSVHTIKGAAEYVGLKQTAALSHRLESLLDTLRKDPGKIDRPLVDTLIAARDRFTELLDDLAETGAENRGIEDILARIEAAGDEHPAQIEKGAPSTQAGEQDGGGNPEEDLYVEEYDAELFAIFLEQLNESIAALRAAFGSLREAEPSAGSLQACLDTLAAMSGSANYMGYERANRLYAWMTEEFGKLGERLEKGKEVDFDDFSREILEEGIRQVEGLFARPAGRDPETGKAAPPEAVEAETPAPDDEGALFDRLESAFDEMTRGFGRAGDTDRSRLSAELFTAEDGGRFQESIPDAGTDGIKDGADAPHAEGFDALFTPPGPGPGSDSPPEASPEEQTAAAPGGQTAPGLEAETASGEAPAKTAPTDEDAGNRSDKGKEQAEKEKPLPFMEDPGRRSSKSLGRRSTDKFAEKMLKQSVRVDAKKIDALINQVGELVVNRAYFSQLYHEMKQLQQHLQQRVGLDQKEMKQVKAFTFKLSEATVALGRAANDLQEGVMRIRMLPIAQLFNRYPRLVHDLVKESGKRVKLDIRGEETELDKMIIEEISDPMIHIIRNAVDHGIEAVDERLAAGKPETGTLKLEAYHESNHVVVEISDDGGGIDIEKIKSAALERDLYSKEELDRMTPREITSLIMKPGFSTAARVTHTSGRGVGMDVVKKNIEKLNGTLDVESSFGRGTRIRLKIPLTLAIIPALLVRVSGDLFTIPLSTVDETIRIDTDELTTIEGVEVLQFRDGTLPIVRLTEVFNMPEQDPSRRRHFVVVVSSGMKQMGIVVDSLIGQEEVVIKPLEDYLQENSGFSGATILGDGRISLILDIYELINLTIEKQARRQTGGVPAAAGMMRP